MLDLDVLNPDWQFAETHGMASKTGFVDFKANDQSTQICKCCHNFVHQEKLPICVHSKELAFLGFGFPLFYSFMKNCILLLVILICSYSGFSLFLAITHNLETICDQGVGAAIQSQPKCKSFMVLFSRSEKVVQTLETILRIISFAIFFIFLIYMRNSLTKLESYYRQRSPDITDYSIILKNLPLIKGTKTKIRDFFLEAFKEKHHLSQIILVPFYESIYSLKQKKRTKIKQLQKLLKDKKSRQQEQDQLQQQINEIQTQIIRQYHQYKKKSDKDEIEAARAIIIVETENQKMEILNEFERMENYIKLQYFGIQGRKITMKTAPEPKQIIWLNMARSNPKLHFLKLFAGWFFTILLLGVITVIFFFVLREKGYNMRIADQYFNENNALYSQKLSGAIALVYIMLFFVFIFNKLILVDILHAFARLQKHTTTAGYQFSFASKFCIALFFTTALMTLAVEAFALMNYNTYLYGVIDMETLMFFINSLMLPLFWLLNPKHQVKKIRRYFLFGSSHLTQREANQLMEGAGYIIGKRYAEVIEIMWFTSLYSSLIPFGACLSLIGLLMYYWVDRYNLQRRLTIKQEVSGKMTNLALKMLDVSLLLQPLGQILFDEHLRDGYQVSSLIMAIVALVYLLLPINKIIWYANKQQFNLESKRYSEVDFKDTYMNVHPLQKYIHHDEIKKNFVDMGVIMADSERKMKSQPDLSIESADPRDNYEVHFVSAVM